MIIHHVPSIIPKIFKDVTWNKSRAEKKVYLTFDDGPVPEVTDFVLALLAEMEMKATFFMVGDNLRKYPQLGRAVVQQGHGIGNHTFHHVNGFKTPDPIYLQEIENCQAVIKNELDLDVKLFRPPYGRITKSQFKKINPETQLIMWDVLTGDYDPTQSAKKCLEKTIKYTKNGSVIVFHDQLKSYPILRGMLRDYLLYLRKNGYQTGVL